MRDVIGPHSVIRIPADIDRVFRAVSMWGALAVMCLEAMDSVTDDYVRYAGKSAQPPWFGYDVAGASFVWPQLRYALRRAGHA